MVMRMSLVGVKLAESEWERRVKRMSQNAVDEPMAAIGTVYENAPRAVWRKQAPTQPGVYQFRTGRDRWWKVAEVFRDGAGLAMRWSDFGPLPLPQPGLEWADRECSTRIVDVYADDRGRLLASWSDIDEFSVSRPGMLWGNHAIQGPE